jgi:hypothetical protein
LDESQVVGSTRAFNESQRTNSIVDEQESRNRCSHHSGFAPSDALHERPCERSPSTQHLQPAVDASRLDLSFVAARSLHYGSHFSGCFQLARVFRREIPQATRRMSSQSAISSGGNFDTQLWVWSLRTNFMFL